MRIEVVSCLTDGRGIRAKVRITGVNRGTVASLARGLQPRKICNAG
jgi:hypothetical protein